MTKKNFNKDNLYKLLSEKTGFSLLLSKKIINDLIEIIIKEIKKENFNLVNLGKFKIIFKKDRLGRNPKQNKLLLLIKENQLVLLLLKIFHSF